MARDEDKFLEDLKADVPHVADFLRALEAAVPGVVSDGLLALLDGAAAHEASLLVLAAAMRRAAAPAVAVQQGRR